MFICHYVPSRRPKSKEGKNNKDSVACKVMLRTETKIKLTQQYSHWTLGSSLPSDEGVIAK